MAIGIDDYGKTVHFPDPPYATAKPNPPPIQPKVSSGSNSDVDEYIKQAKAKDAKKKTGSNKTAKSGETSAVIGMPPGTHMTDNVMINSMPILEFTPVEPQIQFGMTIYRTNDVMTEFSKMLGANGFSLPAGTKSIKVAYIADSFPTDTFSNEYSESFIQQFGDMASEGVSQINQFTGSSNIFESFKKGTDLAQGSALEGPMSFMGQGAMAMQGYIDGLRDSDSGMKQALATGLNAITTGARLDFPQIWKNSSFSPSYSITVRLFNPFPKSDEAIEKFIIAPLAVLLCMGLPRSKDGSSYRWPFLHRIKSPGIWSLNPAFISNIAVVKGGDSQCIGYNQRMGIVDVRIDFGSVYNSILAYEDGSDSVNNARPTLKTYLDSFRDKKPLLANVSLFANKVAALTSAAEDMLAFNFGAGADNTIQDNTTMIAGDPGNFGEAAPASRYDSLDSNVESKAKSNSSFYNTNNVA